MTRFFVAIVFMLACSQAQAQLTNTKWQGHANIPSKEEIILDFRVDTLEMILASDKVLIETMSYKLSGDTLTLTKVSGRSPCEDGSSGKYKAVIKDGKMVITVIADPCMPRELAFDDEPWILMPGKENAK